MSAVTLTPHPAVPYRKNVWGIDGGWIGFISTINATGTTPVLLAERRNGRTYLTDEMDDAKHWLADQRVQLKGVTS